MRTRTQPPQQATPLCIAVNTLPSVPARAERRFAESCGALRGFFMELSPVADEGERILRNAVVRHPPEERESGARRGAGRRSPALSGAGVDSQAVPTRGA